MAIGRGMALLAGAAALSAMTWATAFGATADARSPPPRGDPASAREGQWVYRDVQGDGARRPTAIFLSFGFDHVILKAECAAERGRILLTYFPDPADPGSGTGGPPAPGAHPPFVIGNGAASVSAPARMEGARAVAVFPADARLLGVIDGAAGRELLIRTDPAMEDPWFVGSGAALRRLAAACR